MTVDIRSGGPASAGGEERMTTCLWAGGGRENRRLGAAQMGSVNAACGSLAAQSGSPPTREARINMRYGSPSQHLHLHMVRQVMHDAAAWRPGARIDKHLVNSPAVV